MPKITKTAVDNLTATGGDAWLWDSEVPGFGLRCQASGRKTYVVRYRNAEGVQRKMNIGRACDLTPDQARALARKKFAEVASGNDPLKDKAEARDSATMKQLRDKFITEHSEAFKKASSQASDKQQWDRHIMPFFGENRRVRTVDQADVLKLVGNLSKAGKFATANLVLASLSKAFNLAEVWKMRPVNSNPCRGIKKFKLPERELILNPDQLAALNVTLHAMTAKGEIRPEFAAFIRLLTLTGCRKSEIMLAKSKWIDLHQALLLLPDSKVGQRRIPLVGSALKIAESLVAAGGEWLIPGRCNGQPLKTPYKVWAKVKLQAGLPKEFRLHDLRHTAGSLAHQEGATQKEIQGMLGHKQMSTTERYLHAKAGAGATRLAGALSDVMA
jgi:integrase